MRSDDASFSEGLAERRVPAEVLEDPDALLESSAEAARAARGESTEGGSEA